MIGIIIVSLQERHAVYRRAGHETNVTRACCTRRAVGMRPPQSVTSDGARRAGGIIRAPGLALTPHGSRRAAGHAKTCWPSNAGRCGTGGGGGGGSGERNETGWQLACQSGGRTASTSCMCVDDRESCVVSLSTPGLAWHMWHQSQQHLQTHTVIRYA